MGTDLRRNDGQLIHKVTAKVKREVCGPNVISAKTENIKSTAQE